MIRSGDLVRRLDERWADDFELLPADASAYGPTAADRRLGTSGLPLPGAERRVAVGAVQAV